ncbi:hypothetical protein Tco_0712577 [Tanacetum coccineum]
MPREMFKNRREQVPNVRPPKHELGSVAKTRRTKILGPAPAHAPVKAGSLIPCEVPGDGTECFALADLWKFTPYYDLYCCYFFLLPNSFGDSDFLLSREADSFLEAILIVTTHFPSKVRTYLPDVRTVLRNCLHILEYCIFGGQQTSFPFIIVKSWMLRKIRSNKGAKVPQAKLSLGNF